MQLAAGFEFKINAQKPFILHCRNATLSLVSTVHHRNTLCPPRLMCDGILPQLHALPGPDVATCVWALARLGSAPPGYVPALLRELLTHGSAKMAQCRAQHLADLAWALSRLQVRAGPHLWVMIHECC